MLVGSTLNVIFKKRKRRKNGSCNLHVGPSKIIIIIADVIHFEYVISSCDFFEKFKSNDIKYLVMKYLILKYLPVIDTLKKVF